MIQKMKFNWRGGGLVKGGRKNLGCLRELLIMVIIL